MDGWMVIANTSTHKDSCGHHFFSIRARMQQSEVTVTALMGILLITTWEAQWLKRDTEDSVYVETAFPCLQRGTWCGPKIIGRSVKNKLTDKCTFCKLNPSTCIFPVHSFFCCLKNYAE